MIGIGETSVLEAASWTDESTVFPFDASTCLFVMSSVGQSVRVLPEGCISVCQTRNLWSGVGMVGLGLAGCPLCSHLPIRQRYFSFLLEAAETLAYLHNLRKMLVPGKRAVWPTPGWEPLGSLQSCSWHRALASWQCQGLKSVPLFCF